MSYICLHWFNIPVFVLSINQNFLAFITFVFGLKLELLFPHSKRKSFVYMTANCELCISLITRRLKCWLTITNAKSDHSPLISYLRCNFLIFSWQSRCLIFAMLQYRVYFEKRFDVNLICILSETST